MRALAACAILIAASCGRGAAERPGPPPTPDNLTGRPLGVRGAEIGWQDRSGGSAWSVVERSRDGGAFEQVATRQAGTTVWRDWGLAPDTPYRYRVRAVTAAGESTPSQAVEILTLPTIIPEPRVAVLDRMAMSPGVTLFNVEDYHDVAGATVVMAVDEEGTVVWHLEQPGQFVTETDVTAGGDIIAQVGGAVSIIDRDTDLVGYVDAWFVHHDVDELPWGNLIAITSEETGVKLRQVDRYSKDRILEIDPVTGDLANKIMFDELVSPREICRACITTKVVGGADWTHVNALDYDLDDEALYVSVRNLNRIYKISYPEGEVEWVMGDGGDFGAGLFHHQHNPVRLGPGRMLVFDNGLHAGPLEPDRSRVIEIEYDPEARAARIVWEYAGPPAFFSEAQGDASRLPNGNTLVTDSAGPRVFEIDPGGMLVWELTLPKPYVIYKAHRIENFL